MIRRKTSRIYYRMRDACDMTGVAHHTLRSWEHEFGLLRPPRDKGGKRIYREQDLKIVLLLKNLIASEGSSFEKVRTQLKEDSEWVRETLRRDLGTWLSENRNTSLDSTSAPEDRPESTPTLPTSSETANEQAGQKADIPTKSQPGDTRIVQGDRSSDSTDTTQNETQSTGQEEAETQESQSLNDELFIETGGIVSAEFSAETQGASGIGQNDDRNEKEKQAASVDMDDWYKDLERVRVTLLELLVRIDSI